MIKYIGLLISIALLGACTEKGKPYHEHTQDQRKPAPAFGTRSSESEEPLASVKGQSLQSWADRVLDPSRIRNPKSRVSRAIMDELLAFNSMLLKNPDEKILRRYSDALNLDCEGFSSSCFGQMYFRQAANSFLVAKVAAKTAPTEEESARLILTAIQIKTADYDADLSAQFLEKGAVLVKAVKPSLQNTVRSMLDSTLMLANQKTTSPAELNAFLKRIHAYDLLNGGSWGLSSAAQDVLWEMLARGGMIPRKGEMPAAGIQALAAQLATDPLSVLTVQKKLRAKGMFNPAALDSKFIDHLQGLDLLCDGVFTGQLSPQSAAVAFLAMGYTGAELAAAVEGYARLRFALAVHESSLQMGTIMKANVPTDQLLEYVLRQSSSIKNIWGNLQVHMNQLHTFASIALKKTADGIEIESDVSATFSTFSHQVNLTAVYPQMLVLFYNLSKKNFKIYLQLDTIDTAELMTLLFHGHYKPLFPYTDEKTPLNRFEILYAFDQMMRTRLLQTMDIEVDEFISNTLTRLSEPSVLYIENNLDYTANRFKEAAMFRELQNACAEFSTGIKIPRTLTLDELRSSPYYGSLIGPANLGVSDIGSDGGGSGGSIKRITQGLFFADTAYSEMLERTRLEVQSHIASGKAMIASYEDYLMKYEGLNREQSAARTEKSRAIIKKLQDLTLRVLTETAKYQTTLGQCYIKMNLRDFEIYDELTEREEKYLRQVHSDIKRLREGQAVAHVYGFSGMPSNFKGLDRIDKDGYSGTDTDFLIRLSGYLKELEPQITVNLGTSMDVDDQLVSNPIRQRLQFVDNQEEFVRDGLRAIFPVIKPYVYWVNQTSGRIGNWVQYQKTLTSLYRLERDLFRKNTILSAKQLIEEQELALKLVQISPHNRQVLKTLKKNYRFDLLALDHRMVVYRILMTTKKFGLQDIWSLFDMPTDLMNLQKIGKDYENSLLAPEDFASSMRPLRHGFREMARIYFSSRSATNRGRPLLSFNPSLDRVLDKDVIRFVANETEAITDYYSELDKYSAEVRQRPLDLRPRADIQLDLTVTSILSPNYRLSFDDDTRVLNAETQNCYVRKCVDFK